MLKCVTHKWVDLPMCTFKCQITARFEWYDILAKSMITMWQKSCVGKHLNSMFYELHTPYLQANISQHLYISLCYLFSQLIWWHRYTWCPMTLSWRPMGVKAHHFAGHTATWPHKDTLKFWQKCGIWHHEMQYLTVYEQRLHRYIRTLLTYLHFVIWQIDIESHYIRNIFRVYVDDAHLNTWSILSWWIVACSASCHDPFMCC